jgi:thioredoxin reductase (NADPH)
MGERYDLIVIGAGPAGLAAAIYASRARIRTLVVDESVPGGQVKTTHKVSNYPGFAEDVSGKQLAQAFAAQAQRFGARLAKAVEITAHDLGGPEKRLVLDDEEEVTAPAAIVATGARPRELGLPGESRFKGRGISWCATCDGAYFDGKDLHVVGGGNSAVEESLFLTQFARSVTVNHQFDELQAEPASVHELRENPKIRVLLSHEPRAFHGETALEAIEVEDLKTKALRRLPTDGVFVFVGMVPRTEILAPYLTLAAGGYVETTDAMETAVPGLYAAGDLRLKRFRQITTAVADGTIAALAAQRWLKDRSVRR